MKWLIILGIRLYRRLLPSHRAGHCIFKESCTHHVARIAREQGSWAGIRAFMSRVRQCRHGYHIVSSPDAEGLELMLCDGTIVCGSEISPDVFRPLFTQATRLDVQFNGE